jgi:hypothetical protein
VPDADIVDVAFAGAHGAGVAVRAVGVVGVDHHEEIVVPWPGVATKKTHDYIMLC